MKEYVQKVRILVECLPYIKDFKNQTVVIKCGGVALEDDKIRQTIMQDIVLMRYIGIHPIVVHGGGVQITQMQNKLGLKSEFVDGLRVTDAESASVLQMVLAGSVNKKIVSEIQTQGVDAVGICGTDAGVFEVQHVTPYGKDLGFVGRVKKVNTRLIENLVANDFVPVIAPVSTDENGVVYNINADDAAEAIATAMKVQKLVYLSDIQGVQRDVFDMNSVISHLKIDEIENYIEQGVISGGMIPKIQSCKRAIEAGVGSVHILDGRLEHSLLLEIFTDHGIGTMIEK